MNSSKAEALQDRSVNFAAGDFSQCYNHWFIALAILNQGLVPSNQLTRTRRRGQRQFKSVVDISQTVFHSNSRHGMYP